jgi:hypothetical protein
LPQKLRFFDGWRARKKLGLKPQDWYKESRQSLARQRLLFEREEDRNDQSGVAAGAQNMNQKQREALVDLLLLGMFADGSLKVSDDQKLRSVIEEIGWESYQTPDLYFQSAIAKARDASDTESGTRSRLKKINEALASDDARQLALERLERFLSLDSEPTLEESKFLELAKENLHGEKVA